MPQRNIESSKDKAASRRQRIAAQEAALKEASCNLPAFGPQCSKLCRENKCPADGGIDNCVSPNKPQ